MICFSSTRVGLDPGTANTLLYVKGRGIALNEPSVVTVRTSTGDIECVGGEAEAGRGRTPRKFQIARPIRGGSISDFKLFNGMLDRFLRAARLGGSWRRLKAVIAIPSGMTEVERLAIIEALRNAGAAEALLVDQVLAAARGAGLPIEESRGQMVVNIGAGVTDAAVLSLGHAVCARAGRVAGDDLDSAIVAHVQATHRLIIGEPTAERLKIRIGAAAACPREPRLAVKGRCATNGVPREATIRSGEVREAIAAPLARIVNTIGEALEQAPPELTADLFESGIVLTGGSALLRNLDQVVSRSFGLPVRVAPDPLACVVRGLAFQLNHRGNGWRRLGNID